MKTILSVIGMICVSSLSYSQAAHVLQGASTVNWSMGGAATAQPLDILGAMRWNPATISNFDNTVLRVDFGMFSSSPELFSTVPEFDGAGIPTGALISGSTKDDRPIVPLPSLGVVFGKEESKHTIGFSAIGISGAGVTFPENLSNPINLPQNLGGIGRIESDYAILQAGASYSYQVSDQFSFGVQPSLNLSTLELIPNPTANPTAVGYPLSDKAIALAFGTQFGVFYESPTGIKLGASYKTKLNFGAFDLENTYLDESLSENSFTIDFPAIISIGVGYTSSMWDLALDYRHVNFEDTEGLASAGWTPSGSVLGFGWSNISIISAGVQLKSIDSIPIRLGYTYSSNPINEEVAFFNSPAVANIKHAFQLGFSYIINEKVSLDAVFHYGTSGEKTSGPIYNPLLVADNPPFGEVPGSMISFDMTTAMGMVGLNYTFIR